MTAKPLYATRADATLAAIGPLLDGLEQALEAAEIPAHAARRTMLSVEEIIANAAMHAGISKPERAIALAVSLVESRLEVVLSYPGGAFDPSTPRTGPHEAETIGGHGIFLVQSFADSVEYRRDGALNVVTIRMATDPA